MNEYLKSSVLELIRRASTDMPVDVEQALRKAAESEESGGNAYRTLSVMLENIELARDRSRPLCQDTGTLLFWVEAAPKLCREEFTAAAREAVKEATEKGLLRRNCVDTLSGRGSDDNWGNGMPVIHWNTKPEGESRVSLVLKGGGCENVGTQYALPEEQVGAERDLEGVRRCCLDAVWRAQGRGCSPGVLGVCVGGDRASGYQESKRQFLRIIGERSQNSRLAALESQILEQANQLNIGPMGVGGRTALLDVFIGSLDRLPASYFVTVSYMCWSFRRQSMQLPA